MAAAESVEHKSLHKELVTCIAALACLRAILRNEFRSRGHHADVLDPIPDPPKFDTSQAAASMQQTLPHSSPKGPNTDNDSMHARSRAETSTRKQHRETEATTTTTMTTAATMATETRTAKRTASPPFRVWRLLAFGGAVVFSHSGGF